MILKGSNIWLRALEPEDIGVLYEWENNSDFWVDSQTLNPYSKYLLNDFIDNASKSVFEQLQLRLVIVLEKTPIGFIDLFDIDLQNSRAAIGILIAYDCYRNKGYASEALYCIEQYAKKHLNLHQIYADVICTNHSSMRLFKRNNFMVNAIKKDWVQISKLYFDVVCYQKIL